MGDEKCVTPGGRNLKRPNDARRRLLSMTFPCNFNQGRSYFRSRRAPAAPSSALTRPPAAPPSSERRAGDSALSEIGQSRRRRRRVCRLGRVDDRGDGADEPNVAVAGR